MTILRSIAMAFLMFSKIPMPHVAWKDESMRYTLAFFPLVGVVIGALLLVWFWLCQLLGIGSGLFAAGLVLIPLAVTGGIHIDGLVDTSDALGSHADPRFSRPRGWAPLEPSRSLSTCCSTTASAPNCP